MTKSLLRNVLVGCALVLSVSGCAIVNSSLPGLTSSTGEAWYTEATGLGPFLAWDTKIYYCPPATTAGPVQCKEAKQVEAPSK